MVGAVSALAGPYFANLKIPCAPTADPSASRPSTGARQTAACATRVQNNTEETS